MAVHYSTRQDWEEMVKKEVPSAPAFPKFPQPLVIAVLTYKPSVPCLWWAQHHPAMATVSRGTSQHHRGTFHLPSWCPGLLWDSGRGYWRGRSRRWWCARSFTSNRDLSLPLLRLSTVCPCDSAHQYYYTVQGEDPTIGPSPCQHSPSNGWHIEDEYVHLLML